MQPSLESQLMRAWMHRGPVACLLWPLSLLYGLLTWLRRALFRFGFLRATRLPVPVIVVGNVFIGGTGKTPFTIWLVEALRRLGYRPGVVSRGYGSTSTLPRAVGVDATPTEVGDEPLLIARRADCPVFVGRDRSAAAKALLAAHPQVDVLISDDGLQHYALARDVEIVLFDARGAGNGWLLPAGPLREPATRRRDFTVVNGTTKSAPGTRQFFEMRLVADRAELLPDRSSQLALAAIAARQREGPPLRVVAAAGIGNPGRFFRTLQDAGLHFSEFPLPDHYDFSDDPFQSLEADMVLVTEKDAVKCAQNGTLKNDPRLWVVPVTAQLDDMLAQHIVEKCLGSPTA